MTPRVSTRVEKVTDDTYLSSSLVLKNLDLNTNSYVNDLEFRKPLYIYDYRLGILPHPEKISTRSTSLPPPTRVPFIHDSPSDM